MIREQNSRFDVFLAGLAESLSDSRVGCAGVSPSAKGDLFFDFIISGENYRIVLRPLGISLRDGISEPFMDQRLVLLGENQGAPGMELLKRVAERLGALMNDASLRKWIDRRNRNIFEISFSVQGFLGLFGDTVSLKTPFWRDWRVEEVGDLSGGCFLILLKDGRGGEIDLTFGTSGKGIAEGISILITPIGELVLRRPEAGAGIRKVGEGIRLLRRGSHATGPETALAYLLARGTHAGMSWKTPEQPSGGAGDVGRINTRVSLIENCFRSGVSWRGFASRFFNVWGDIDHFG
ncbi:MAG: hypothetical protein FJ088_01985, partial [Deltaproteobacteria bacterium]|nr:hypothetical protein [Deltaproteobacteria bacterium]